jgi:hypothetical protein
MPAAADDARTICLLTYCCLTDYLAHFSADYLAHKEGSGSLSSGLPEDQVRSRRFNDVHRQGLKAVDRECALHLRQQANEQAEVAAA